MIGIGGLHLGGFPIGGSAYYIRMILDLVLLLGW